MEISIRAAASSDIPALQALIPLSARALSQGWYTPQQIESAIRYVFGVDSRLIADGTYYVALGNGDLVGCGGWSRRKTLFGGDQMKADEDPLLDPAHEAARIRAFFVHPQYARRGIGRLLIQTCEEAARAAGFSRMELAATLPGEPLYAAMGYVAVARFAHLTPDGTSLPLVHMAKSLVPAVTPP
ncbi:MAG: GNAT family N-acetyltransferase [candidate division KSB1 bacterium]|nr:GNAT family N-acetyltransferase [candidate division KSB1 bacterium]MDZ7275789.1 GNAT family N-acetyltransferase [candidate division KSB1 bacterium]MDZ7287541.1 GNAT family N-acetyltransferase [candidate division KSB1 bacterium]MDZ7307967.1 GNAT family N-acetyltransferase [candidate division KSB1 bacterium]MDZ7350519.1 GNAT family N-acetyltransferase [candidate division KSB1 bacterium]